MGAYGTKYFEMVRADVVDETKKASAAIVGGIGVMISGNGTVATIATTETLLYGIAMHDAASGEGISVLIKGIVSVLADGATATIVVSGEGAGMTYGTLAYVNNVGKWLSTTTNAVIVGRVVNEPIATGSAERAEIAINVGAFFTPTE